jgi:hypothetical protein
MKCVLQTSAHLPHLGKFLLAWAWAVKCKTVFTVKTCRFATFILFEVSYFVLRLSVCFHPREEEQVKCLDLQG